MNLEKKILENMMPILEKGVQEEYFKIVKIFIELIKEKEENSDFFKSPIAYLKKNTGFSFNSFKLPNGETVELIDADLIKQELKKCRELYKKNPTQLVIPSEVMCVAKENIIAYSDWKAVIATTFSTSPTDIDFGPLMSPINKTKIKEFLKKNNE